MPEAAASDRIEDVVDMAAAADLQAAVTACCMGADLGLIMLVLMNEVANTILHDRPTLSHAHRAVDMATRGIRDIMEAKIRDNPEWLQQSEAIN